jgi:TolA-binding protein
MPSNPAAIEATDQAALGGVALEESTRQAQPRKAAIAKPSSDVAARDESRALRTSRPSGAESSWGAPPPPDVPPGPPLKERVRDKSLKSELGFLEEARVALEARAGANALTLLDEYARRFPAGSMRIEATALRIEALLALGRRSDAQALGDSFLANYPKSPAAMRVRLLLGSRDNTPSKP